ncbi:MAG: hypothetical protein AAGH74_00035 [Pseudomonadota bacterium]
MNRFIQIICLIWLIGSTHSQPSAQTVCDPPLKSFRDLAEHLETLDLLDGSTVLHTELLIREERPCRGAWVLDVLTVDGDVQVLLLDAQTFTIFTQMPADLRDPDAGSGEPAWVDDEILPARIRIIGTAGPDILEGSWSDDISTGNAGRDVFKATPGSDIITDFDPSQDVLSLVNFSFDSYGLGTLQDVGDVGAAIGQYTIEGKQAAGIDLDGEAGDWTVFLIGVAPEELSEKNIVFTSTDDLIVPVMPRVMAERRVTTNQGSKILLPSYSLDDSPAEPVLVEGSEDALQAIRRIFGFNDSERRQAE